MSEAVRKVIWSSDVGKPGGPYSHAVMADKLVFVSGQGAKDAATGQYVSGGIKEQTRQTIKNIDAILRSTGCSLSDVIRVGVFLRNIADFENFNQAYSEYFKVDPPARTTVQAVLPNEKMLVEMEAVALVR